MSSSSGDDYHSYRRSFPVHDAAEAGDMEALTRMLRPPKKASTGGASIDEEGAGGVGSGGGGEDGVRSGKVSVRVFRAAWVWGGAGRGRARVQRVTHPFALGVNVDLSF